MAVYYLMTTTIPALLTEIMPFGVIREYNPLLENYVDISYLTGLYDFVLEGAFSLELQLYAVLLQSPRHQSGIYF